MPQQRIQHSGFANGLPYGLRPVIVAILAALVTLTTTVGDTHAQPSVPAAPTGLIATSVSHDSVTLSWDDPGDTSITGYQVLRRDTVNQAPGTFSTVEPNTGSAATTYTDSTVAAETRYVYRVKAINPEGTSEQSNYVNVETPAAPTPSVPAAPTGLTATSVSHDSATLTWDDPGDGSITGYQVLRRSRDGDEYGDGQGAAEFVAVIDDTGSAATTYTDTSVAARTRYVYRVKAINSEGMSERSTYLNVETPEQPTPEPTPTNVSATGAPTITGTAQVGETLTADTSGIADADGLANVSFSHQWMADDTEIQGATHHSYTLADADEGKAITVRVSFTDDRGNDETLTSAATAAVAPSDQQLQSSRPNVVLILADDLGWGDVETNNPDSAMTTPHIDSIAAAGVHFTDAHSPSALCSPTRYGLLTGRYPWRSWLTRGNIGYHDRPLIGPNQPTLATLLKGHGYHTAAIGKWHLGVEFTWLSDIDAITETNQGIDLDGEIVDGPLHHGFDEFFGTISNLMYEPRTYIRNSRFISNPATDGADAPGFYEFEEVLDTLTEEAVSFIEGQAQTDAPFFLYLPLPVPHTPLAPNEHFAGLTGLGPYSDFVAQMDWTVGQVLDALDRIGTQDDTLVIFTSDNGSFKNGIPVPNHADHQSNGMWRGTKGQIYEGGHRVPLLMRWPTEIEVGMTVGATVSLTDLYATLADILGEKPEPGVAIDSSSLLPLLSGEAETRGAPVVHHSGGGIFALRDGRWKLAFGDGPGWRNTEDTVPFERPWHLFDMEQDPGESTNVAADHPEVMAEMEAILNQIRAAEEGTLSDVATLKSLRIPGVDLGTFAPDVLTYAVPVGQEVETVRVVAHPRDTDARIEITTPDGRRLYDRQLYGRHLHGQANIELSESATTIKVTVTSADLSTTAEYTVILARALEIIGTPRVGQTLTAVTSGISKVYGLTDATLRHQWLRSDGSTEVAIAEATGETYTLTTEDQGKTIRVRVSFTDDRGNDETETSPATAAVGHAAAELTPGQDIDTFPVISGYSDYGELGVLSPDGWQIDGTHYTVKFLLQASESLVLGLDEQLPTDFTLHVGDAIYRGSESMVSPAAEGVGYWWPLATPDWSAGEPIQIKLAIHPEVPFGERPRAPVTGYFRNHPPEHDGREDFTFRIHFSEGVDTTADALRDHVLSVTGGTLSSVEHIRGEGRIWGVSVTPDSRDAITIVIEPGLDCELPGAVCTTDGRRLFNRMGLGVPMRPNNRATGTPTIIGTVEAGETLFSDTSAIADADGMTAAAFNYQWVSYDGTVETDIQGATDITYTLGPADEGKAFRVRVSYIDDAGFDETLTSALARLERPYGLSAMESDGGVILTWKLPAGWTASSMFQILRNRPELGEDEPLVHVRFLDAEMNVYTDTDVEPGVLYVYRVKGVDPFGYTGEASAPIEVRTAAPATVENRPASGVPTISGTVEVGETLTVDVSGIADADGLTRVTLSYQWISYDGNAATDIERATGSTYSLVPDDEGKTIRVRVSFTDDEGNEESLISAATSMVPEQTCQDGYLPPAPTEVAITAVPIEVESTAADYFVLYASHDVDGETVWYPVLVKRGEDGTTTLSESVASLPVERYRVERYSIANPGDVDGDCIDDITELNNLGAMNPINRAATIEPALGALAIPDQETFEALAYHAPSGTLNVKFAIVDRNTDRPRTYFQKTTTNPYHDSFLNELGIEWDYGNTIKGMIIYDPELVAPDGSRGLYRYYYQDRVREQRFRSLVPRAYTLLAANIPLLHNNLALWIHGRQQREIQDELPLYRASRMSLVLDDDVYGDPTFQALNLGEGYGLLRNLDSDERPHSRDVVIYEALPNELPRVAGIISTVPQTPLSHVNLRALQDRVPNAYIADALEDDDIGDLIDSHVHYAVNEDGYTLRAATQDEVDEHYASLRPAEAQTPERDLSVTSITALSDIGFDDWDAFGVKAANVAVLRTLGFPEGTVPDGFAVPFYFYDEFMKHNDLYDDIREMLADPDFQSDYVTKVDKLKELRKKIKKAETPEWIIEALTAMHATFPEGTSLRYRSSTNNEDLPGFNGAGLYDSKTQHPEETEEDGISKSLKQVYASLWNFRAFIERDFHRIDHMAAAMGVLVHPNYTDELVNGVAVSADPAFNTDDTYYVNSQVGEDLVTNPVAHSVPEEALMYPDGTYTVARLSNQVPPGQLLMTDDQLAQLRSHLDVIHQQFAQLYGVEEGEKFAMEIEFKITSDDVLAIKQARPWIFSGPSPMLNGAPEDDQGDALTATFAEVPATHDGSPFIVRIEFSEFVTFRNPVQAVTVTGGRINGALWGRLLQGHSWKFEVIPDSSLANVTLVLHPNRPCSIPGSFCTYSGRRLSNRLEFTVNSFDPDVPDRPTARVLTSGAVELEWNDVPRAQFYEVQFRSIDQWLNLPANGAEIEFSGAGAVVTGLPDSDFHYFRVRAANSYRVSEWSATRAIPMRLDWESQLVAGWTTNVFPAKSGYSTLETLGGTLSAGSFEIDGTAYQVRYLIHASGSLWLGMDRELPADFTLLVGDSTYGANESMVPPTTDEVGYWWPSMIPDWSAAYPVRVGLTIHHGTPSESRQKAPVAGYFHSFPSNYVWGAEFSFRIHFSEGVDVTADALRNHVLSVSGGTVSGVEAVGSEGSVWDVSATPASHGAVTVLIEPGLDCELPGAVCTTDGRRLHNRMELRVAPTDENPPTGLPTISGTVEVGQTLTADTSGIADGDGMTGATFSYQWVSYDGHAHTDIQGATNRTYTLVPADEGKAFRVRVSFTEDAGFSHSLTSSLARWERPYGLDASESDGSVVLTWKLPAGWSASSMFQILRNRPELGEDEPLVHVRFLHAEANVYTDTGVEPGVLYVYRVKGVDPFGYTGEASRPFEFRTAASATVDEPDTESNNDNNPATGPPSIRGAARVGVTLRASLSNLDDADGMSGATFGYEWLADGAVIPGATSSRYTPVAGDAGKTVTVRVSFTDDAGNEESLTSEPTAPVAP